MSMMLRRTMMGGGGSIIPEAASILAKLSRWYTLDADYSSQVGEAGTIVSSAAYSPATGLKGNAVASVWMRQNIDLGDRFNDETEKASIGGWVYLTSNTTRILLGLGRTGGSGECIYVQYLNTGNFVCGVRNASGTVTNFIETGGGRALNTWYLVGMDYDNRELRLRVNGAVTGTVTKPSGTGINNYSWFQIGSPQVTQPVPGRTDEAFGCYKGDACLTNDEWAYLYNSGAGRSYAEVLAAGGA